MNISNDNKETRCPMLGHPVPFSYCRNLNNFLPCCRIMDCWFEKFDIQLFIHANYTDEQINIIFSPPKPKMEQIIELIQASRT